MHVTSTTVTSDGAVSATPATLCGCVLAAGAEAAATLIIYDNTNAASGTRLLTLAAAQGSSAVLPAGLEIYGHLGLYADIGGAGAVATVFSRP